MKKKVDNFVYWAPRILSILFLLFLAMFSLDVFSMGLGFWETIAGLFMHNIPVFILLVILLVSWKHEIVGGVVFILAGLFYIALILTSILRTGSGWSQLFWTLPVSAPAFLVGILFLICWFKKRNV